MNEHQVKDFLGTLGISRPGYVICYAKDGVDAGLEKINKISNPFPIVVKVLDRDILHKTDVNGVKIGIQSLGELIVTLHDFSVRFPGKDILIEEYIPHNIEFIIGVKCDETFGPTLMFGGGGVLTEIYRDVAFRKLPLDEKCARDMIFSTKIGKVFQDYRGLKMTPQIMIQALMKISNAYCGMNEDICEFEINPLVISDGILLALDGKVVSCTG